MPKLDAIENVSPKELEVPEFSKKEIQKISSCLYRHHFDVVLTHADLATIPNGSSVHINVNALSSSKKPWKTLGELDGNGFIVAAFGMLSTYVFELKLFYKALETVLINISNLTDNSVIAVGLTTVFGGTPSEFELQDSVTKI